VTEPAATRPLGVPGTSAPEDRWARQQVLRLAAVFFLVFLGGGAFQQFLSEALQGASDPRALRTTLLAVTYGSFLLWRIGVAWTEQWLGEWASIALGALSYALLPFLLVLKAPAWLLIVGAAAWGFGAASFWVASGTRVLHLAAQSRYGRGTAAIYVGCLMGMVCGLLVQSYLGGRWGTGTIPWWAASTSLAGAALAATLWRGGAPQERQIGRASGRERV
jgi:predicted MFS family arabinose efflux permease